MLKRHETRENFHYFKYKPKPYSDSVQIRWPVDSQCIALNADVAGFLLKMLWARHPTDEEIAWWNDMIDQVEAATKAAEPDPQEQAPEATGAQTLLAATQAPAAQETDQEAVDNGANGTGGVQGGTAAEGGAPEAEEESKDGEQPSEEEGSKEGEEKPSEEQKETEVTSTKKKSSATKGLL